MEIDGDCPRAAQNSRNTLGSQRCRLKKWRIKVNLGLLFLSTNWPWDQQCRDHNQLELINNRDVSGKRDLTDGKLQSFIDFAKKRSTDISPISNPSMTTPLKKQVVSLNECFVFQPLYRKKSPPRRSPFPQQRVCAMFVKELRWWSPVLARTQPGGTEINALSGRSVHAT